MNFLIHILLTTYLVSCSFGIDAPKYNGLDIQELTPSKWTSMTKQNILHLAQVYDLEPFLYIKKISIKDEVLPRSNSFIYVGTRFAQQPKKILSTLLREEFYWWLNSQPANTNIAITEFKKTYSQISSSYKSHKREVYLNLMACFLEFSALKLYLGQKEATSIITELMKKDKIYTWAYDQILYKNFSIKKVMKKYQLFPAILETNKKSITLR